jgi:hypothetical protein
MWYKATLAALDAAKVPLIHDLVKVEEATELELVAMLAVHLHSGLGNLRATDEPMLEGYLLAGIEVQKWASLKDCERSDAGHERFRQRMMQLAQQLHSRSSGSPSGRTRTVNKGSPLS